ncbi:hypothetical protein IFR04_000436 [Cadophora malorum]|uniref:SnoaL-like domain-containing protein n=1 Tax=Cadophora malorum TaxID=108018 RepID=A0A8H7WKI3_9HELO|nr:hypothetical protein IFR04_000436 [Cadophora malorum]
MRTTLFLAALASPFAIFAARASQNSASITPRQLVKPPPCVRSCENEADTKERFEKFADAFIVKLDITEAFTYIVEDYINHNPLAQNGSDSAWGILSPIWGNQTITVLGTKFISPQGWLNYQSAFGTIVDRFRWEGGCIVEHWDQGEVFPA